MVPGVVNQKKSSVEDHSEPAQNTSQPPQSSRPKPVPNYRGTPAYKARHASQAADINAEDFDAATALVSFQRANASEAETTSAHHASPRNTIRVPPLKPKRVVLTQMDKIFAGSMGMSRDEMIEQKEWEQEHGSDAWKSDAEDNSTVTKSAKEHQKKKVASTESEEAPMDVNGFEDEDEESEPGV